MTTFNSPAELSAYLDKYRPLIAPHTEEDLDRFEDLADTIQLPSFYTFAEPRPDYDGVIAGVDGGFTVEVVAPDGSIVPGSPFASLTAAYDTVRNLGANIIFSGDKAAAGITRDSFITENSRLLLISSDSRKVKNAKYNFLLFLFATEEYYAKRDDFFTAYNWVLSHPAFWSVGRTSPHYWNTNYGSASLEIIRNDKDELVYMLEAGAAVEPERVMHYHDLRLDVYAPSFEDAYVQLADLVDKFFHVDGSERENVDYVPSDLEILLKERMESAVAEFDVKENS